MTTKMDTCKHGLHGCHVCANAVLTRRAEEAERDAAVYRRALQMALSLCDPPTIDACKEWITDREARDKEFG